MACAGPFPDADALFLPLFFCGLALHKHEKGS